jgi:hypothetical protein
VSPVIVVAARMLVSLDPALYENEPSDLPG